MRPDLILFAACFFLLSSAVAEAKFCWGTSERLIHVKKLPINSPSNKPFNLARLLRTECLGLPYTVTDAGFVLAVEGEDTYFPLSEEEIASFQSSRALPRPMPAFEMSTTDWLVGHLLWITIPVAVLWAMVPWRRLIPRRRPRTPPPLPRRTPSARR
jgi:hypothetical protein